MRRIPSSVVVAQLTWVHTHVTTVRIGGDPGGAA